MGDIIIRGIVYGRSYNITICYVRKGIIISIVGIVHLSCRPGKYCGRSVQVGNSKSKLVENRVNRILYTPVKYIHTFLGIDKWSAGEITGRAIPSRYRNLV